MFKRHKWFTFYTFGLGSFADLVALVVTLCIHKSDPLFITSLIVALLYLLFVLVFANNGTRRRFYNKGYENSKDYRNICLIAFTIFAVIFAVTCIVSLTLYK